MLRSSVSSVTGLPLRAILGFNLVTFNLQHVQKPLTNAGMLYEPQRIIHTVGEALPLNVIKHLGGIREQAATSHTGHRLLLRVRTKMFFQSMFAPHHSNTTCQ